MAKKVAKPKAVIVRRSCPAAASAVMEAATRQPKQQYTGCVAASGVRLADRGLATPATGNPQ
jgi:hypothetical protein